MMIDGSSWYTMLNVMDTYLYYNQTKVNPLDVPKNYFMTNTYNNYTYLLVSRTPTPPIRG